MGVRQEVTFHPSYTPEKQHKKDAYYRQPPSRAVNTNSTDHTGCRWDRSGPHSHLQAGTQDGTAAWGNSLALS